MIRSPFKTKSGRIVVAQTPNAPLMVWFVALVASKLLRAPHMVSLFEHVSFGAIFIWAWLEIFEGVNVFRRVLGLVVLIGALYMT